MSIISLQSYLLGKNTFCIFVLILGLAIVAKTSSGQTQAKSAINKQIRESKNNLSSFNEVKIEKVLVNLVEVNNRFDFCEDENNFEFIFGLSDLSTPKDVHFQYHLEGIDAEWRTTIDRHISYPELKIGKYTFRIRASIDEKYCETSEYTFVIHQKFYNSIGFKIILIAFIGLLLWKWKEYRENDMRKMLSIEKLSIENQLINLKNQLNPHFLFNSFNTLISLIEEDPEKGIAFTEKMTDFYRLLLKHGKEDVISLSKEISILKLYISILKERFNEQLKLKFNLQNSDIYLIPTMTLQLLVENAVKHNVLSSKMPLIISISQEGEFLIVTNNINPLYGKSKGTGTGLVNILRRFELNALDKPIIKREKNIFIVKMKLRYKQL